MTSRHANTPRPRRAHAIAIVAGLCLLLGSMITIAPAAKAQAAPATPVLYGVTGDGAAVPETLYTIDPTTAVPTLVTALGNGDDGEEIAYNPATGLLFHTSGIGSGKILETIDPSSLAITPIPLTAYDSNEVSGLTYNAAAGHLLASTRGSLEFLNITSGGAVTLLGSTDHTATGLAFSGGTLYSVARNDAQLRTLDPATGATLASVTITGTPFAAAVALATHPTTGVLYAVHKSGMGSQRGLVTIDPSGVATLIGPLNDSFAGLAWAGGGASITASGTPVCIESALVQSDPAAASLGVGNNFTGTDDNVFYRIISGAPTCSFNCLDGFDANCDGKLGDVCPVELNLSSVKGAKACLELHAAASNPSVPALPVAAPVAPAPAAIPVPGLATTGTDTDSLLRAGLALIAAGTTALGIRRHHNKQQ